MKKFFIGSVCLCLLLTCFSFETFARKSELRKVKVIEWNVWNGFASSPNKNCVDDFVEFLKKEDPDVVGLTEICHFDEKGLSDLAARYGHKYVSILLGDSHPVAITSKEPMEKVFKQIEGFGHGMVHCNVMGIDFLVTHLTPGDDLPWKREKRNQEARNIVNYIHENNLENCVLMGDLNSISPFDAKPGERDLGRFACMSILMGAPLNDICYMFNSTIDRTTYPTQIKRFAQDPQFIRHEMMRLDYFMVTDALFPRCVDGIFYKGSDVESISDHLPIGMIMMLDK